MKKKTPVAIIIFAFAYTPFSRAVPANAQHLASGGLAETAPPLAVSANRQQKDDFIKPSRPTVSEPADIQRVGVLQLEFGLDAEFDAKEFRNQQTTPLENVARKDSDRRADGGLFSIALSHRFENHVGLAGELSGQSLEYTLPRGVYPFGGVTYQVNRRLRFDAGLRFGIGAQAPRVSVVTGFVFGIADLY